MDSTAEVSHDAESSNQETADPQMPPGFDQGLCAITFPDGDVRYVAGWDRYVAAESYEDVYNELVASTMFQSREIYDRNHDIAQKVSSPDSDYRQLFVVLSKVGVPEDIFYFIEAKATDDCLPFSVAEDGEGLLRQRKKGDTGRPAPPFVLRGWDRQRYEDFHSEQWVQLALRFQTGESYEIHPCMMVALFPWVKEVRDVRLTETRPAVLGLRNCDFSGVHELFKLPEANFVEMAVKRLGDEIDNPNDRYKEEVGALRVVARHSHKHVLPLLSSFTRYNTSTDVDEYFLIFPQSNCGMDLPKLWKEHAAHEPDNKTLLWMLSQCRGIVDALAHIHHRSKDSLGMELVGRHGNINAQNILVFKSLTEDDHLGTLVLSNFEKAKFCDKSRLGQQGLQGIDSAWPPHRQDIWSLGCILLLFVAWFIGGGNLLERLRKRIKEAQATAAKAIESNPVEEGERLRFAGRKAARKKVVEVSKQMVGFPRYADVERIVNFVLGDMLVVDEGVDGKKPASMDDVLALFTKLLLDAGGVE